MQLLTAVVLLAGLGGVWWDRRRHLALEPTLVGTAHRPAPLPEGWPATRDEAALEGFEGTRGIAIWRWDPSHRRLLFGRSGAVVLGERGWMVGTVDVFGSDGVRWKHFGDSFLWMFWAMSVVSGVGLTVVEGEWPGLLVGLVVLPILVAIRWVLIGNASVTLTRSVLPVVAKALRAHLDENTSPS